MFSYVDNKGWIVPLLIILLVIFVLFIIAVIIFVFIPIGRIEGNVNNTLSKVNKTADDVENLVTTTTGYVPEFRDDLSKITSFINIAEQSLPQLKAALCTFLPNLPYCTS